MSAGAAAALHGVPAGVESAEPADPAFAEGAASWADAELGLDPGPDLGTAASEDGDEEAPGEEVPTRDDGAASDGLGGPAHEAAALGLRDLGDAEAESVLDDAWSLRDDPLASWTQARPMLAALGVERRADGVWATSAPRTSTAPSWASLGTRAPTGTPLRYGKLGGRLVARQRSGDQTDLSAPRATPPCARRP